MRAPLNIAWFRGGELPPLLEETENWTGGRELFVPLHEQPHPNPEIPHPVTASQVQLGKGGRALLHTAVAGRK